MWEVKQHFQVLAAVDPVHAIDQEWPLVAGKLVSVPVEARIAVAVGSRGIADVVPVVGEVVRRLKDMGCKPFIVPAMGSHGGATAAGQSEVLRQLGVTEESVGAPICATMDVVSLGNADGIPLVLDRFAWEADGIVLINRVKPHTDFVGTVESGLMKMLVIGLGKQAGADYYHRLAVVRGLHETVPTAARALLEKTKVLFGVALVENEEHQTALLRLAPREEIERTEGELLDLARQHLPGLPLDDIDILVVDEMGKEISGGGLDSNVIGRSGAAWAIKRPRPRISRIFVRDLTDASEGNAAGLGMVDAVTTRLIAKVDASATAMNAFTSCSPEDAKIPAVFASDRDAVLSLLTTVRPTTLADLRLVYIKNTQDLDSLWVSGGCRSCLASVGHVSVRAEPSELEFDNAGDLVSPFVRSIDQKARVDPSSLPVV